MRMPAERRRNDVLYPHARTLLLESVVSFFLVVFILVLFAPPVVVTHFTHSYQRQHTIDMRVGKYCTRQPHNIAWLLGNGKKTFFLT